MIRKMLLLCWIELVNFPPELCHRLYPILLVFSAVNCRRLHSFQQQILVDGVHVLRGNMKIISVTLTLICDYKQQILGTSEFISMILS